MPENMLPSVMVGLLGAFESCLHAPTYRVFQLAVAGWMPCVGRRTITAVALASGGVGGWASQLGLPAVLRTEPVEFGRRGAGGVPVGAGLDPGRPAVVHPD